MFFVLCCCSLPSYAQLEVGLLAGGSVYGGDVGPGSIRQYIEHLRFSYGAFVRYQINPYLAVRGQYQDLDIFGEDDLSLSTIKQNRNLHFYSDIDELSLQVEIHPFPDQLPFSPYLIGGITGYHFSPKAFYNGAFVDLQPLGTEGQGLPGFEEKYALYRIAVPLGAGLRFNFGRGMFFGLQASGRLVFFDYLDDVSLRYVDETILAGNGPLAVELAYREDELPGSENMTSPANGFRGGTANDYYYSVTAHFSYQFGPKKQGFKTKRRGVNCPKF